MQDNCRVTLGGMTNAALIPYTSGVSSRPLVIEILKKLLEFLVMNVAIVNDEHVGKYPHWRFNADTFL